jgi:hypothetical protein
MTSSAVNVPTSEAERWMEWQKRGIEADRRRAVAMRWVMAVIAIGLGALFAQLLSITSGNAP